MKRFALVAAVLMLTMTVPAGMATHLSAGFMTTAGMEPGESPDDPSVEGDTVGAEDTPYGVATQTDCYNADPEVSAQEAQAAATAEEVCGELVYNPNTPELTRVSPPDQDIPSESPIATFDVQLAQSYPAGFLWGFTEPWSIGAGNVGDLSWDAVHTVGEAAGVTPGPEESKERDRSDQRQINTMDASLPNAFTYANKETNTWEMNGWYGPAPAMERVIAFIEDDEGKPISDDQLDQIVDDQIESGGLSPETQDYRVCGFVPGASLSSGKALTFCEVKLYYQETASEDEPDGKFDGFENKCDTPTYICAAQGPYWRSRNVAINGAFGPSSHLNTAGDEQDVAAFHYVVAPNPSECQYQAPKRLDFDGDGADMPYLAHDLDIYTTATNTQQADGGVSMTGTLDYADALRSETPTVDVPDIPDVPGPVEDTIDQAVGVVNGAAGQFTEGKMIEPNNGDPVVGIPDNSRQVIVEDRTSDLTTCQSLVDNEDDTTRDPWVNVLDARTSSGQFGVSTSLANADTDPGVAGIDRHDYEPYMNDEEQDDNNRPGPDFYKTSGKIGVFADKNDDGAYNQRGGEIWKAKNIQKSGAYPMMWDMRVEEGTQDDPKNAGGGCPGPGAGFSGAMADAGYGPNTALAQAIYLREPTVFTETEMLQGAEQIPYPDGNNIYVLLNNAGRVLWDGDATSSAGNTVDDKVDDLVTNLRAYVIDKHDADAATLGIEEPGAALEIGSDYEGQCDEGAGGFTASLSFEHSCQLDCSGDTIATMYTFEVQGTDLHPNSLGGGEVPPLKIDGEVYEFGLGQHTWFDIDPFDNDPDRNENQMGPPPN